MRRRVLDEETSTVEVIPGDDDLKGKARNLVMFQMWFAGSSLQAIGDKFGITRSRVCKIKKRDKWEKIQKELRERAYSRVVQELKQFASAVTTGAMIDWHRVLAKQAADPKYEMTPEERLHQFRMIGFLFKEAHLADGKPTDIRSTSGKVEHVVKLPPGVKRYGVIPSTDGNVKQVEHQEVAPDRSALSIDDVADNSEDDDES